MPDPGTDDWVLPPSAKPAGQAKGAKRQAGADDWVLPGQPAKTGRLEEAISAVTDIPAEMGREYEGAYAPIKEFGQFARAHAQDKTAPFTLPDRSQLANAWEGFKKGIGAVGGAMYLGTGVGPALTGGVKSLVGHSLNALEPGGPTPQGYEKAKGQVGTALMALGPGEKPPIPAKPAAEPFGVTTPKGPIPAKLSEAGRERVSDFKDQTKTQLESAKGRVSQAFDTIGQQRLAETPGEAGELISQGVRQQAGRAKANVKANYDLAKTYPGEIHAGAFEGFGQKVKGELTLGQNPVIIDDMLTPWASRAIRDVDERIAQLKIQNRASPFGQPAQANITGVNLEGVEQMRKRLSAMRGAAYESGNKTDARATQAVLDAFDNHVDQAIKGGQFTGDPRAVKAWNLARESHSQYSKTFTSQGAGSVGSVVEKIIGGRKGDPAIPNDVADYAYGSTGVNPKTQTVGVMKRLREILGEQSPEWAATKQGLFERIVTPVQGEWKPTQIRDRIKRFLYGDGKEMADLVYSPQERLLLDRYADMHGQLDITKGAMPETFMKAFADRISHRLNLLIAGMVGHFGAHGVVTAVPMVAASRAAGRLQEAHSLRDVTKALPLVSEQIAQWQKAVQKAIRARSGPNTLQTMTALANLMRTLNGIGADVGPAPAPAGKRLKVKPTYGGPQE